MTNRSRAAGTGASGRQRRRGRNAAALTAVLLVWMAAAGDAWADRIVLKSGEVIEGSVIDATRNTVVVLRSIGGMRQMPVEDIEEVRVDLAGGQQIVGQFLGWVEGVYEVRSGDEVVRVGESGIVSREPGQQTAQLLPTRPRGAQQSTAAAPSTASGERSAEPAASAGPAEQDRTRAAEAGSDAAAAADDAERQESETEARTATARQSPPGNPGARAAAVRESLAAAARQGQASDTETHAAAEVDDEAAAERPRQPAADAQTSAEAEPKTRSAAAQTPAQAEPETEAATAAQTPAEAEPETDAAAAAQTPAEAGRETRAAADAKAAAERQSQTTAGEQHAALGDQGILAVKASVDPPAPGTRDMVFNIELSQPAKQTVVLIYGTVDGTAKAGEHYEAQQGMVTLAPGSKTTEVRVPLIEGAPEDGEKRFELVLMADPKVAEVVDRRVIATIKGAD